MIRDLRHRLTLQEQLRTADGGGGFALSWENLTANPVVYAEITPVSGTKRFNDQQMETTATHRIKIRYRSDVTAQMRFTSGDKVYRIISMLDDFGREAFLDILAEVNTPEL